MIIDEFINAFEKLGWQPSDDIVFEIAGQSTYEIDGAGTKWAPVKGTVKYNNDAFLVIKNRTRTPFEPSKPPVDVSQLEAEADDYGVGK